MKTGENITLFSDVLDMQRAEYKNGLAGFAVTDHCDIEYFDSHFSIQY